MQSATSFKSLYEQHYGFVWATVCRFGVTPMLAEDAVHDTFIVAYRRRDAFDGQSPKSWLYSIGRRVASNYRRSRGRRESRHAASADFVRPAADLESDVTARVSLERFLATLSTSDRELFVLSELDGLTGPELSAMLGRKLPTVYGRIRILRQRFREAVAPDHAALREAQEERPRAKASGWLMLQPWLAATSVAGGSKLLLGALTLAAATVVTVGAAVGLAPAAQAPDDAPPAEPVSSATAVAPQGSAAPPPPTPASAPPNEVGEREEPPSRAATAVRTRQARSQTAPRPKRQAPAAVAPEPVYDLAADTKLLQDANAALQDGQPARALKLLALHERDFPRPAQPDLRSVVWIRALCAQDRPADARRRAAALRRTRPNSPLLPRIDKTCAAEKTDGSRVEQPEQP